MGFAPSEARGVPCGAFIDSVRRSDVRSSCGCNPGGTMPTIARKKARKSNARLDVRLRPDNKALIEEAATLSGKTISEYVVSTLLQQSTEVVQRHRHIRLSNRDRNQFLAVLDASDEPSAALTQAAQKYKRLLGQGGDRCAAERSSRSLTVRLRSTLSQSLLATVCRSARPTRVRPDLCCGLRGNGLSQRILHHFQRLHCF